MRIKVHIHFLPLPHEPIDSLKIRAPRKAVNSSQGTIKNDEQKVEHKQLLITDTKNTIAAICPEIEAKYRASYLDSQFTVRNLRDRFDNDLDLSYTLEDIFDGEEEKNRVLKVIPQWLDRESSVPINSVLRPRHAAFCGLPSFVAHGASQSSSHGALSNATPARGQAAPRFEAPNNVTIEASVEQAEPVGTQAAPSQRKQRKKSHKRRRVSVTTPGSGNVEDTHLENIGNGPGGPSPVTSPAAEVNVPGTDLSPGATKAKGVNAAPPFASSQASGEVFAKPALPASKTKAKEQTVVANASVEKPVSKDSAGFRSLGNENISDAVRTPKSRKRALSQQTDVYEIPETDDEIQKSSKRFKKSVSSQGAQNDQMSGGAQWRTPIMAAQYKKDDAPLITPGSSQSGRQSNTGKRHRSPPVKPRPVISYHSGSESNEEVDLDAQAIVRSSPEGENVHDNIVREVPNTDPLEPLVPTEQIPTSPEISPYDPSAPRGSYPHHENGEVDRSTQMVVETPHVSQSAEATPDRLQASPKANQAGESNILSRNRHTTPQKLALHNSTSRSTKADSSIVASNPASHAKRSPGGMQSQATAGSHRNALQTPSPEQDSNDTRLGKDSMRSAGKARGTLWMNDKVAAKDVPNTVQGVDSVAHSFVRVPDATSPKDPSEHTSGLSKLRAAKAAQDAYFEALINKPQHELTALESAQRTAHENHVSDQFRRKEQLENGCQRADRSNEHLRPDSTNSVIDEDSPPPQVNAPIAPMTTQKDAEFAAAISTTSTQHRNEPMVVIVDIPPNGELPDLVSARQSSSSSKITAKATPSKPARSTLLSGESFNAGSSKTSHRKMPLSKVEAKTPSRIKSLASSSQKPTPRRSSSTSASATKKQLKLDFKGKRPAAIPAQTSRNRVVELSDSDEDVDILGSGKSKATKSAVDIVSSAGKLRPQQNLKRKNSKGSATRTLENQSDMSESARKRSPVTIAQTSNSDISSSVDEKFGTGNASLGQQIANAGSAQSQKNGRKVAEAESSRAVRTRNVPSQRVVSSTALPEPISSQLQSYPTTVPNNATDPRSIIAKAKEAAANLTHNDSSSEESDSTVSSHSSDDVDENEQRKLTQETDPRERRRLQKIFTGASKLLTSWGVPSLRKPNSSAEQPSKEWFDVADESEDLEE